MARRFVILPVILIVAGTLAHGQELSLGRAEVHVGGVAALAAQCGTGTCRAAVPVQPQVVVRLNPRHELFVKLGGARGDAHNVTGSFALAPWAADLASDVEDINGRPRSHVLTAGYRYTATLGTAGTVEAAAGILDAADYLDDNAFANDEYTQFLNAALVNGPNTFVPSYDAGAALVWEAQRWSARGVYMSVGDNGHGDDFDFLGVQVGYRVPTRWGEGNYRVLLDGTDRRFPDPSGAALARRAALVLSCDQRFGRGLGVFVRLATQSLDAAVDYGALVSGGFDIAGRTWGRERDNVGIGYAHLDGGNGEVRRSQVFETYYRWAFAERFALTGDVQYARDDRAIGEGPRGWILGVRFATHL